MKIRTKIERSNLQENQKKKKNERKNKSKTKEITFKRSLILLKFHPINNHLYNGLISIPQQHLKFRDLEMSKVN